jgi:hypothetical protein
MPYYKGKQSDFAGLLEKFKEPIDRKGKKLPYVLFGKIAQNTVIDGGAEGKLTPALKLLDCTGLHAHKEKIAQYMSKGFIVLKYFLPEGTKQDPHKGVISNFGDDEDHFETLRVYIEGLSSVDSVELKAAKADVSELQKRFEEEKAKAAKAEKELEALKKKQAVKES